MSEESELDKWRRWLREDRESLERLRRQRDIVEGSITLNVINIMQLKADAYKRGFDLGD